MTARWDQRAAALAVAAAAFAIYRATLLPGFDFGDTGSFQTIVSLPLLTPRDSYPLYFAIGRTLVALSHAEPAWLLNVASAVEGGVACGLLVLVGAELSGSTLAGAAAGLLFAVSYTFWSQAIIAEVYALHACCLAGSLLLLLRWSKRPTLTRLAGFFAVYALGFGDHLSMVLLLPGYTLFLLAVASGAPGGWRSMFAPRVVALAVLIAALGAAQYVWNLRTLWLMPDPPRSLLDGMQTFWFDVTKSDWRDTMVLQVPRSMAMSRLAMYWFDLRQQFGPIVPALAGLGLARLAVADCRRALLMFALYAVNVAFAFGYNVGDSHVFYLPSHLILALLAGSSLTLAGLVTRRGAAICATALMLYAGVRTYRDFPALDRSGDRRPERTIAALTSGLDDRHAVLLTDLNWQIANGLSYFAHTLRPEVLWSRLSDVMLYAPALVADNQAIGRDVTLTQSARDELTSAYGPMLPVDRDRRVSTASLTDVVRALPTGTRYALCVLEPTHDFAGRDALSADVAAAVEALTSGSARMPGGDYAILAGLSGQPPRLVVGSAKPFERTAAVGGVPVQVRMDSWLDFDTIRRMGFGHVIAGRRHTLIVERGVSFAAFDEEGRTTATAYRANIFAPQPRYLVQKGAGSP
ncbi:MAG TPA: DUF2723 domain-containing protein [Vicinamibacterales bacterium]|nr:DUF2723 domain-containing protein [Vicinamibacterales bacterium]